MPNLLEHLPDRGGLTRRDIHRALHFTMQQSNKGGGGIGDVQKVSNLPALRTERGLSPEQRLHRVCDQSYRMLVRSI